MIDLYYQTEFLLAWSLMELLLELVALVLVEVLALNKFLLELVVILVAQELTLETAI